MTIIVRASNTSSPRRKQRQTKKQQILQQQWDSIVSKWENVPKFSGKSVIASSKQISPIVNSVQQRLAPVYRSLDTGIAPATKPINRQKTEKQYTIAPICNKGAYQVITDPTDFATMGRKV
jgi:hypothetical protein